MFGGPAGAWKYKAGSTFGEVNEMQTCELI